MIPLGSDLWDSYISQARQSNHAYRKKELSNAGKRGAWRRWHREKQIVSLLPMVDRIAKQVKWMFAPHLDFRDLTQAGTVGLVNAANAYHPSKGAFEPYAWFRVRGAVIDSQKRRVYREERNVSLQSIAEVHDGWLPPSLDTDGGELPDALAGREEIHRLLADAIAGLPDLERQVIRGQLAGQSLAVTAKAMGRSLAWTRVTLAEATDRVGRMVRGEIA